MTNPDTPAVVRNPWRRLRQYTDARIGLGRAGISLPTSELLDFQLAHARARDSVHSPLDVPALTQALANIPKAAALGPPLCLHSQAPDRKAYLQRPDWGRQLSERSVAELRNLRETLSKPPHLAIVLADGLSSRAVRQNATAFLETFLNDLGAQAQTPYLTPPLLVEQGRVAIGDPIGQLLGACQVIVLIGERPGLSSPDSLGIYLTHAPEPGLPDSRRNCLSNIRPGGLSFGLASQRLLFLVREAERLKTSGVALKDRSNEVELESDQNRNFLVQGKPQ